MLNVYILNANLSFNLYFLMTHSETIKKNPVETVRGMDVIFDRETFFLFSYCDFKAVLRCTMEKHIMTLTRTSKYLTFETNCCNSVCIAPRSAGGGGTNFTS